MNRLIVTLLLATQPLFAAFERVPHGSRTAALGGVYVTGCPWSFWQNPAALSLVSARTLAATYLPQLFGMKELAHASAVYVEPLSFGTVAAGASRFGFSLYHETRLVLAFATQATENVYVGGMLDYYSVSIQSYGVASAFGVDAGVSVRLSEAMVWGCAAHSINAPTLTAAKEKLPQTFSSTLAYSPIPEAVLVAGVVKDLRHPLQMMAGVEYTILNMLTLRAGTSTEPELLTAGFGIAVEFVRFDYAFSSHNLLGPTHSVSLAFDLSRL